MKKVERSVVVRDWAEMSRQPRGCFRNMKILRVIL